MQHFSIEKELKIKCLFSKYLARFEKIEGTNLTTSITFLLKQYIRIECKIPSVSNLFCWCILFNLLL